MKALSAILRERQMRIRMQSSLVEIKGGLLLIVTGSPTQITKTELSGGQITIAKASRLTAHTMRDPGPRSPINKSKLAHSGNLRCRCQRRVQSHPTNIIGKAPTTITSSILRKDKGWQIWLVVATAEINQHHRNRLAQLYLDELGNLIRREQVDRVI